MALTLESEKRLIRVNLVTFHDKSPVKWQKLAHRCYVFLVKNFPENASIHRDDVAKVLGLLLEVNDGLVRELSAKKLKQRYWIRDFGDLIIDRAWEKIVEQAPGA
jgi:hypothetical protein